MVGWEKQFDKGDFKESHLLEKLEEYLTMEKVELQKQKNLKISKDIDRNFLKNNSIKLSFIESSILVGLSIVFMVLLINNP